MKTTETNIIFAADQLSAYLKRSGQFCYIITDINGNLLFANSFFYKKFKHTGSSFTGSSIINIVLPEEKRTCRMFIHQCLSTTNSFHTIDLRLSLNDCDFLLIRWEVYALLNEEEVVENLQWVGVEIENRKDHLTIPGIAEINETEKHLQKSELIYQQELILLEIQIQKQLTQAIIDGQEQERLQIGKELHDNISQQLNTTRLYLEVAKDKATGEILFMVSDAHKNLTDIINEVRHLSLSLVPSALTDLGLIESIKDLCSTLKETQTFHIDFHHHYFNECDLPYKMKLMLFRILQEQINNIVRHAYASHVVIRLKADAENIMLSVNDNGRGFDLTENKKGLGLTNMKNRVGLFNGKVSIDTTPGKGCTVIITIPLTKGM